MYQIIFLIFTVFGPQAQAFLFEIKDASVSENPSIGTLAHNRSLFLTPLIKRGSIVEAQKLAEVNGLVEDIRSYSGYITVSEKFNSNLFFWYFPALAANEKSAPLIVWLQGGPGASSMFGLLCENGPVQLNYEKWMLERRVASWANEFSMLFIDQPAGTGFSFTKDPTFTEERLATEMHEFFKQFYELFPYHINTDLYITGESYAGKMIPAIAKKIMEENYNPRGTTMPLVGLAMGDGLYDLERGMYQGWPNFNLNSEFFYQLGFIDEH